MSIPGKSHKEIATNQHENCEEVRSHIILSIT
jgi:hypothetical protein